MAMTLAVYGRFPEGPNQSDNLEIQHLTELQYGAGSLATEAVAHDGSEEITDRSKEVFKLSRDPNTYEVSIDSDLSLENYEKIAPADQIAQLKNLAKELEGKKVTFVNATMEGGGVAMLRPTLIHMLRQLGVDAHWHVMEKLQNKLSDDDEPYVFTKTMHNITQRRSNAHIDEAGKDRHRRWSEENEQVLLTQANITNADIIVVDDPQPARLIEPMKTANPEAKIIWRNHIDNDRDLMANPTTPQGEVWRYLHDDCGVGLADAFVYHPVESFVPYDIDDKTYLAPATIDEFDDLNKDLNSEEIAAGLEFINSEIITKNAELIAAGRPEDVIKPLDPERSRITLVARFDESKGMDKAIELGVRARQKMRMAGVAEQDLPEIVIVGNGSIDDPSGPAMYEQMLKLRRENYQVEKDDIIIMRLKHNYQAMNALMHFSDLGMQTSEAEGCETRITDWIDHGVPVIVSNRGGMSLQIIEGESGFVLDYDKPDFDLERGAEFASQFMTDKGLSTTMYEGTAEANRSFNSREFSTVSNAIRWARIFGDVLANRPADKHWLTHQL